MANVHCVPRLVSGIRRAETDVIKTAGRGKILRKFSTGHRMSLPRRATRSEHGLLNDFHAANKDFNDIFDEMKNQLSQCKISKDHEELREHLYEDLKEISDLILMVLSASTRVARVIRDVVETAPHHELVADVRSRLTPAWQAINAVNCQLYLVADRLGPRSEYLKHTATPEDPPFKALCEFMTRMNPPEVLWPQSGETGLGVAPQIWSGIRPDPEEFKMLSTKFIQCLSNIGAVARFKGFLDQAGFDAPVYNHDAFKATGDSLLSVKDLTKQLGLILGNLEHSWLQIHREDYEVTAETPGTNELLGIAEILDEHVKDCMVMASNIQRNFSLQKELLSPVELYEERKWQSYGAQALRSCPKRAATLVTYVEKRISKVHRVIRSRYMTSS